MSHPIEQLSEEIESLSISSLKELEDFRLTYLSKKGKIPQLLAQIGKQPAEERKSFGQKVNQLKVLAQTKFEEIKSHLENSPSLQQSKATDDITLQPYAVPNGTLHPLTIVLNEIKSIFFRLGFTIADGPELEDDFHNFTALNFPSDHPARDMQDTFFIRKDDPAHEDLVLRTHTSPVQIRLMQEQAPPIRAIMPGRVYRNEAVTYKSYFTFNQVEGLYIDKGITFGELKETLIILAKMMYGNDVKYRMRPSFFPFTEPSLEMDIWDHSNNKWMEILGAGMVDPNVLKAVQIDPETYSGFAFGLGIERMALVRFGITDIRDLYENDIRLLSQFAHLS